MSVTSRSRYQGSGGHRLVWIVVMSLATNSVCFALNNQNYRLEKDLLRNYSRTVRPVQNLNTIINVSITFVVFSIFHIDEQNQAMTQNSYIALRWFDEFLKWDPQEYGGLTTIELSSKAIWLPYMDSINTFDPSSLFSSDQLSNAVVQASGQITWFQQNVLTTICRMDITYFPFDSQLCNISVSMWTSSTSQVQISEVVARQDDVFFVENSQWILKSLEATLGETSFGNESYSAFTVSFYLKVEKKNVSHADTHHPQCPSGLVGLPGVSDSLRWRGEDVVHNGTAAGHWGQLDSSDGHNAAIIITHLCPHDLHWCTKHNLWSGCGGLHLYCLLLLTTGDRRSQDFTALQASAQDHLQRPTCQQTKGRPSHPC
ncbi:neuronal acetylcholine receptor subunit non-alpha-2-like isoform X2 [Pomacea canaliculata]|uniref:neuronal acetylcholine receptor subunit non-alpha-2-like isoform X2 n=1 Tax=Pomacea canaliculata TaxID=400727 RepID=UPI000D72B4A7|nr:neuronal acetylcholine receptor subunit non-alpha-2-like isoform X2 [Pomacea canaliculata]